MKKNFKTGDFIFYTDKYGATQSTKVWGKTKKRLIVENWEKNEDEFGNMGSDQRYVSPEKCQLQSEWEKEHNK